MERQVAIQVRVTPEEKAGWQKLAAEAGVSLSEWIRGRCKSVAERTGDCDICGEEDDDLRECEACEKRVCAEHSVTGEDCILCSECAAAANADAAHAERTTKRLEKPAAHGPAIDAHSDSSARTEPAKDSTVRPEFRKLGTL